MAKHTPGPWMQDEDRPYDILFDDRAGENVTPIIASVHTDNTDDEQWQADARLIAAAPDLRAALIAAKQEMWLAARSQWTMADFKNWAIVQQIDAALEKADGMPRTEAAVAKANAA